MKTRCLAASLVALVALNAPAMADEGKGTEVAVVPVAGTIHMLMGKGGNIGLFTGPDGTFLIDDQYAPATPEILAAIKSVGGSSPRFIINTHYHGDHTGGNENLGKAGALILSHDNVRRRLAFGAYIAPFKKKVGPLSPEGLPVATFSETMTLHINGETARAIHVPTAHTDGDAFILFEKANAIHAGDLFFNGFYPFIDVANGGTLRGMIAGIDAILAIADDKTKIIPGHGPLATKADLQAARNMLQTAYDRLRTLKAAGKTAAEAVSAAPLDDLEKEWGDGLFSGDRWIEITYPGVH